MTATPERTDGENIFNLFNNNIAYEIRLHKALEENMLCPFHYYGITDITINGHPIDEESDFSDLVSAERVERIIEKSMVYGHEGDETRSLVFCSRKRECSHLAEEFVKRGLRAIALTGENTEEERKSAIDSIQSNGAEKIDYIFSVDIFNEGVDIPKVNQIIMLRPTQSAIIFIQQLGRGLRKSPKKSFLTVIDFIGNYKNNFLVPIALFGDRSFEKDRLRKLLSGGSRGIPGESTINFDLISKERIFEAINNANMHEAKDLKEDYENLKYKLGKTPMMMDFIHHGSRDPYHYVKKRIGTRKNRQSYFSYTCYAGDINSSALTERQSKLLESFDFEINNGKRQVESFILNKMICGDGITIPNLNQCFQEEYGYPLTKVTLASSINNLNFKFATERHNGSQTPIGEIHNFQIVTIDDTRIDPGKDLRESLENETFSKFLRDSTNYSLHKFGEQFDLKRFHGGFSLYQKYRRKDVFRILGWERQPVMINVGGYMINPYKKSDCAIFVNYHKKDDISLTQQYEDVFLSPSEFQWMSKSNRTLTSQDVTTIRKGNLRLPLFVKKSNDEGDDFYYMGDLSPKENSFKQESMQNDKGKDVPVVKVLFSLHPPVQEDLFNYITSGT